MKRAFTDYVREVRSGEFPTEQQSFTMNEEVLAELTVPQ